MRTFNFDGLFIYDMANNHQGDIEHGLNIIDAMGKVTKDTGVRGALKFQFRQLDTFINPNYKDNRELPHIHRFMSTKLSSEDYAILADAVRKNGMYTICTPFDEESVDLIRNLGIEVIKIASCSADDWPLIECIAATRLPIVVDTAGLMMNQIDKLVSFLEYNYINFALMHCVALYPTPEDKLELNMIRWFKNRYPHIPIGFSTHENPDNYTAIQVAYAKGVRLFERHVGIESKEYKLNKYSSCPEQVQAWIRSYKQAVEMCGGDEIFPSYSEEIDLLRSLKRGVFAKREIQKGEKIKRDDVFFAMPLLEGQLQSGHWSDGLVAEKGYIQNEPVSSALAETKRVDKDMILKEIMLQIKGILNNARIFVNKNSVIEISHHYGLDRFREYGAVIITCIDRVYCKKLVIQLPRQKHPYHFHKKKEETFQLLYGDIEIVLDGRKMKLNVGDTFLVLPNQWHKFHTLDGTVFEEVSTTHYNDDSFYEDEAIKHIPREQRKTYISGWQALKI